MGLEVRQLRIVTQYSHLCDGEPLFKLLKCHYAPQHLGRKLPACRDAVRTEHCECARHLPST